jgi:hypothetical protein
MMLPVHGSSIQLFSSVRLASIRGCHGGDLVDCGEWRGNEIFVWVSAQQKVVSNIISKKHLPLDTSTAGYR